EGLVEGGTRIEHAGIPGDGAAPHRGRAVIGRIPHPVDRVAHVDRDGIRAEVEVLDVNGDSGQERTGLQGLNDRGTAVPARPALRQTQISNPGHRQNSYCPNPSVEHSGARPEVMYCFLRDSLYSIGCPRTDEKSSISAPSTLAGGGT